MGRMRGMKEKSAKCISQSGYVRMDSRCFTDARQTLGLQETLPLISRPETREVQIHVSGIMLRYKSRNYADRDKHAKKQENTIIFQLFRWDYVVIAFVLFVSSVALINPN